MKIMPIEEIHRRVIDRLNAGSPAEDRSILVSQTVHVTIAELKEAGFIDTEELYDDESAATPHE